MPRYIEENDIYKLFEGTGVARIHCIQIDELPRADVQEVRHGKWITIGKDITERIVCSNCGSHNGSYLKPPFCSQCGAKMDGEE